MKKHWKDEKLNEIKKASDYEKQTTNRYRRHCR